ncbi:NAD(P)-binding protein [Lentinus brumalis]|uniref:NAD(P)-binding protein n=1 Tax=Lentinus brumalis TaxID=2498619 RepID=A0A371D2B7_9APHY|nr:NAD(P)-binding protein [Polyporus brumalis]
MFLMGGQFTHHIPPTAHWQNKQLRYACAQLWEDPRDRLERLHHRLGCESLLDRGFNVRGTVRSYTKGAQLQEIFNDYGDRFEFVIVADIAKKGAFDETVKDVDAIAHTASPLAMNAAEPDELIVPAVNGTTGLLASARQFATTVKRVILTSTGTAIASPTAEPRTVDESDWNETAVREVREKGREASQIETYRASKTLAERAAWEWYDVHVNTGTSWVDVRDVAEAHVLALLKPEAGGERIVVTSGPFKWQDLILAARRVEGDEIPIGNTSYDPSKTVHFIRYRTEREERILGLEHRSLDETTRDLLRAP